MVSECEFANLWKFSHLQRYPYMYSYLVVMHNCATTLFVDDWRWNLSLSLCCISGVAGCVINDKNEVLVVQEKWLRSLKIRHWKLPGGVAEPGRRPDVLWPTWRVSQKGTGTQISLPRHTHTQHHQFWVILSSVQCNIKSTTKAF